MVTDISLAKDPYVVIKLTPCSIVHLPVKYYCRYH